MEEHFTSPLVDYAMVSLPKLKHIPGQILAFGGWDGKSYTNKLILIDEGLFH